MAKKKNKKKLRNPSLRYKPLVDKLQSKGIIDVEKDKIIYEPKGVAKMSEVLLDFIKPYAEYAETFEAYEDLIMVAIVAWNIALISEKQNKDLVKEMIKDLNLSKSDSQDMRNIMQELIERKKKHFAEYNRIITDYQITEAGSEYRLSVASTFNDLL